MATKTKASSREAIIVLGMHRSGTSAVSGVLAKLGAQAPRSLMPPTQDNPRGYWESSELMKFHDRVLESAGHRWDDWDHFDPGWIDSADGRSFVSDLSVLLDAEYGEARLFLVKDPRMCRLFPLWADALAELDIAPKVVVPVRHPAEVVRSLATRDQMGEGQARLLWLRHLVDAEAASRGFPRAFLRYADLLDDWQAQVDRVADQLQVTWPRRSNATVAEVNEYLTARLRHHVVAEPSMTARSKIAQWVGDCHRVVQSLVDDPGSADAQRQLDSIRREFDETSEIFAPIVHEQRHQLEHRLDSARGDADRLAAALEELNAKHEALHQENLQNYQLYDADHKALAALREELRRREQDHAERESLARERAAVLASELEREKEVRSRLEAEHGHKLDAVAAGFEKAAHAAREENQARENRYLETVDQLRTENRQLADAARAAEESLQERFTETAKLAKTVLALEDKLAAEQALRRQERDEGARVLRTASEKSAARLRELETALSGREAAAARGDSRARVLEKEIEAQGKALAAQHAVLHALRCTRLRPLVAAVLRATGAGVQLHQPDDERSDAETLRRSHLFDREWYLDRYPDVRSRGMDPVGHYLKHGSAEGRDPCACFSTKGYVSRYPDVVEAGINPLVHYLKYGRYEGRVISAGEVKVDNAVS